MDYIILPGYVGSNNEHYLPDMRGKLIEIAKYELKSIGFNTEIIISPFNIDNNPSTVIKMFPRAFTKVKNNRTINKSNSANLFYFYQIYNFLRKLMNRISTLP